MAAGLSEKPDSRATSMSLEETAGPNLPPGARSWGSGNEAGDLVTPTSPTDGSLQSVLQELLILLKEIIDSEEEKKNR